MESKNDMTAAEYFNGEGSPMTLDTVFTPTERDFLLEHIELYAKGKVNQALQQFTTPPIQGQTKEEILDYNYHSFIGTRHSADDWPPLENMNPDLKECIYACMQDFAREVAPTPQGQQGDVFSPVKFAEWILSESILPRYTQWFDAGNHYSSQALYEMFFNAVRYSHQLPPLPEVKQEQSKGSGGGIIETQG